MASKTIKKKKSPETWGDEEDTGAILTRITKMLELYTLEALENVETMLRCYFLKAVSERRKIEETIELWPCGGDRQPAADDIDYIVRKVSTMDCVVAKAFRAFLKDLDWDYFGYSSYAARIMEHGPRWREKLLDLAETVEDDPAGAVDALPGELRKLAATIKKRIPTEEDKKEAERVEERQSELKIRRAWFDPCNAGVGV